MLITFKKIILSFLVIFLGVILISLIFNWQIGKIKKTLPKSILSELELKKPFEEINKQFFQETSGNYKEFTAPDGKLKIKYPDDWLETDKTVVENLNQKIIGKGAEILFFAQKLKIKEAAFVSLVIQELNLEKEKTFEEIIEEIKQDAKEKGAEMDVLKTDKEKGIFEAKYKKENQPEIYSLEKIIIKEKKAYLIVFLVFNNDLSSFRDEANEILNSAQLIQ